MSRFLIPYVLLLAFSLAGTIAAQAQHEPTIQAADSCAQPSCLKDYFLKGHFHGRVRNHFMATVNAGSLKDYWTNATGGSIHYKSVEWRGWTVGLAGIFTFQTLSTDLYAEDTSANASARWEKELYDLSRPGEKKDLDRLEELFVQYHHKGLSITAGKQHLTAGPMVRPYDGRMKPFVFHGINARYQLAAHHRIGAAVIDKVSPRGFTEWYKLNEAIGLTNNGCTTTGDPAHYHEHTNTRGLAILHYEGERKNWHLNYWNYHLDRIFNLQFAALEYRDSTWFAGIQYAHQTGLTQHSSQPAEARYIDPDGYAAVTSAQVARRLSPTLAASASYLHVGAQGRFLFPKELGRDAFYVSQARSRLDGLGATDVLMLGLQYDAHKWKGLHSNLALSRWQTPGIDAFALNKYNVPSYYQLTWRTRYQFGKKLNGLECSLLYVARYSEPDELPTPADAFGKTNFHHVSVVTNLLF